MDIEDMIIRARRCGEWTLARDLAGFADLDELAQDCDGPDIAYEYVMHVARGRVPELERIIGRDGASAAGYAARILGGRWIEAEPTIQDDAYGAYLYARDVIGGRWEPGERAILAVPWITCEYVRTVVRGPWKEAEEVLSARWPEFVNLYHDAVREVTNEHNA